MVRDELWAQVYGKPKGHLCIGCFEKRLGRFLNKKDFTAAPINCQFHAIMGGHNFEKKSPLLRARMEWDEKTYYNYWFKPPNLDARLATEPSRDDASTPLKPKG